MSRKKSKIEKIGRIGRRLRTVGARSLAASGGSVWPRRFGRRWPCRTRPSIPRRHRDPSKRRRLGDRSGWPRCSRRWLSISLGAPQGFRENRGAGDVENRTALGTLNPPSRLPWSNSQDASALTSDRRGGHGRQAPGFTQRHSKRTQNRSVLVIFVGCRCLQEVKRRLRPGVGPDLVKMAVED